MEHARPPTELNLEGNYVSRADTRKRWKMQFNLFLKASGVHKEEEGVQASLLINLIEADGFDIYETFTSENEKDRDDVVILLNKFDEYFGVKPNVTLARYNFFMRSQEPGESINQYVTALKLLSRFPKCPEIRSEWIKAVRCDNWEPTKYSRLCSKHFEKSCYVDSLLIKKLKTDAVPTMFEGYPLYYQSVPKKRKPPQRQDEILITPRKLKKMQESGVNSEDIPTTPRGAVKIMTALAKSRKVAARRLIVVKKLRESRRRLVKKNVTLLNVISDLKSRNFMDTEFLDLLSRIGEKNKDLMVRLGRKGNNECFLN